MGSFLILIKHSIPEITYGVPANQWQLSQEGIRRCRNLAQALMPYDLDIIRSSHEPKAQQTAQFVAEYLGLSTTTFPDLHEHLRNDVPILDQHKFEESVQRLFNHPNELVFGEERAVDASHRFDRAVSQLLTQYPEKNIAIFAHGTIISLYVARHHPIDQYSLWKRLGLPSFIVLSTPEAEIVKICDTIE